MTTREETLERIRRSLHRPADAPAPEPLPPLAMPVVAASRDDLVRHFTREMEGVGGSVTQLARLEDIGSYLDALPETEEKPAVVVTSGIAERIPPLARWVAGRSPYAAIDDAIEGAVEPDGARRRRLLAANVGVTGADYAIADTGTLVLVAGTERHRLLSLLPPVHVCVVRRDRVVANLAELLERVRGASAPGDLPPSITFITGPSRSADIELTLTRGVHGPREVHVLMLPAEASSGP